MAQLAEAQEYFGPHVSIDDKTAAEFRPSYIDLGQMGENLARDFPKLNQDDWSNVQFHFTDRANVHLGGYVRNALLDRHIRVRQLVKWATTKGGVLPSNEQIAEWSAGNDVLVVVNTSATNINPNKVKGLRCLVPDIIDMPHILAHELKHAADELFENRQYKPRLAELRQYVHRTITGYSLFGSGCIAAFGGWCDLTTSVLTHTSSETAWVGSGASMVGGVILANSALYLVDRVQASGKKRYGIPFSEFPYGEGEDCANAYAIATRSSWDGVVQM